MNMSNSDNLKVDDNLEVDEAENPSVFANEVCDVLLGRGVPDTLKIRLGMRRSLQRQRAEYLHKISMINDLRHKDNSSRINAEKKIEEQNAIISQLRSSLQQKDQQLEEKTKQIQKSVELQKLVNNSPDSLQPSDTFIFTGIADNPSDTHLDIKTSKSDEEFRLLSNQLKKLYFNHIKPMEEIYLYDRMVQPLLRSADFDAKPMVLLLGQYSIIQICTFSKLKFKFIFFHKKYFVPNKSFLLKKNIFSQYMRIGPEPTTDKWSAIMRGGHGCNEARSVPGHTVTVQPDRPFASLIRFGSSFLERFEGIEIPIISGNSILDRYTLMYVFITHFEFQLYCRSYDFNAVVKWFASRVDRLLLFFDANKLDISDEFEGAILATSSNANKIRVVLNKADQISGCELLRVYGALLWALGKVLKTPEVTRIYLGSFWNKPLQGNITNKLLFKRDKATLLDELYDLPRNNLIRKSQMPLFFGKVKAREDLVNDMANVFFEVSKKYRIPTGDFPNLDEFRKHVSNIDDWRASFRSLRPDQLKAVEDAIDKTIPKLMSELTSE
eukprot:GSMAST32.ASY1.ANO1.509.1 assembled CDS